MGTGSASFATRTILLGGRIAINAKNQSLNKVAWGCYKYNTNIPTISQWRIELQFIFTSSNAIVFKSSGWGKHSQKYNNFAILTENSCLILLSLNVF